MAQYIIPQTTLKRIHQGSRVYETAGTAGTRFENVQPDEEVLENPTVIPTELMRRFKHAFLIRTPEKTVPSYYQCVKDKMAGFEYFDGAEAGFEEVRILYKWISNPKSSFNISDPTDAASWPGQMQVQPQPPPLVDASILLASPVETIKHLCDKTGIPFEESMLSWDAKPQAEFAKWGAYHQGAENSTGFKAETCAVTNSPAKVSNIKKQPEANKDIPKEIQDTIEYVRAASYCGNLLVSSPSYRTSLLIGRRNMEPYEWLFVRKTVSV